ncbi:MAG: metallophosphoesterase family protein [Novosphingobium sp.]|nr:serine/threonine protein phosphatase [Novosphingobium sp.]
MIDTIRQLFRTRRAQHIPAIPAGERVYAIGDIHGRLDLITAIAEAIEEDDRSRGPAKTKIVLLGDLIDRGPDSAAVLHWARDWQERRNVRILAGNHEEMFLQSFAKSESLRHFLRFGGYETVLSYPVDRRALLNADLEAAQQLMREAVPETELEFIRSFENLVVIGDYLFVHAGIKPGAPLDEQRTSDLRWIREPFLSHGGDHGYIVVHGHSISEKPDFRSNRIGIDTGAFMSGRLTALGLEGTERWLIETNDHKGVISVATRPA